MKKTIFSLYYLLMTTFLSGFVVINEFCPNPIGSDQGFEWIELYNPTNIPVNLRNWKIQTAGTVFTDNFTFPFYILNPDSFVVVGEDSVVNADFHTDLDLQNGGSSSDGVRLVKPSGLYTDTVIYDEPNTSLLPDDVSSPSVMLLPPISQGYSYSRKTDGFDGNAVDDWQISQYPTPRKSNHRFIDLEISDIYKTEAVNGFRLLTVVHNLSTIAVDNSQTYGEVLIDEISCGYIPLSDFDSQNTAILSTFIHIKLSGLHTVKIILYAYNDINGNNNEKTVIFVFDSSPLLLSEIMYDPGTNCPEWIEITNVSDSLMMIQNGYICDSSNGKIHFTMVIHPGEYRVITSDKNSFSQFYPLVPEEVITESSSWTYLNNGGDNLKLYLSDNCLLDSVCYIGDNDHSGVSLERTIPEIENQSLWHYSIADFGCTPGEENSHFLNNSDNGIFFSSIHEINGHLTYQLNAVRQGEESSDPLYLIMKKHLNNFLDGEQDSLFIGVLTSDEQREILIESDAYAQGYTFMDFTLMPLDDHPDNNGIKTAFLKNSLPAVVNEIMYNPLVGEPEWLEIRINEYFGLMDTLKLVVGTDSLSFKIDHRPFFLLTGTMAQKEWLESHYLLADSVIITGLGGLSNNGEQITLYDRFSNRIESFYYRPEWSKTKGVSIERLLPLNPSADQNWSASTDLATPGSENSVYMTAIPSVSALTISPDPFSPYRQERCQMRIQTTVKVKSIQCYIFNLSGIEIFSLQLTDVYPFDNTMIWDGTDRRHKRVLPGIYPVKIIVTDENNRKIINEIKRIHVGY